MLLSFEHEPDKNISNADIENSLAKLPLIAQSQQGYKNLMFLVTHSFLNRQNGISPHKEKAEGLVVLSGATEEAIAKLLLQDQNQKADALTAEFSQIFGKNVYIEITRHGMENEQKLEEKLIEIAFKYNLPLVATNDAYF